MGSLSTSMWAPPRRTAARSSVPGGGREQMRPRERGREVAGVREGGQVGEPVARGHFCWHSA
eukprot:6482128-Pyramimonas_sp.AAC.1